MLDDPRLPPTEAASDDTLADTRKANDLPARVDAYRLSGLLGKGGMGEVWAATDDHLGREVALKRMRTTAPTRDELTRFLREARIQARLPHPSVVPVYELGTDSEGFPFFTMKRLGISRDRRLAQRALIIQGWHLRHLLPERTMRG